MRMLIRAYPYTSVFKSVTIIYNRGKWTVIRCDVYDRININQIESKYAPRTVYKEMVNLCYKDVLNHI